MYSLPSSLQPKRPYANRQPPELCRRAQLSVRVHENARSAVFSLASRRGMSASEYVARLLNDHIRLASQPRRPSPVLAGGARW